MTQLNFIQQNWYFAFASAFLAFECTNFLIHVELKQSHSSLFQWLWAGDYIILISSPTFHLPAKEIKVLILIVVKSICSSFKQLMLIICAWCFSVFHLSFFQTIFSIVFNKTKIDGRFGEINWFIPYLAAGNFKCIWWTTSRISLEGSGTSCWKTENVLWVWSRSWWVQST